MEIFEKLANILEETTNEISEIKKNGWSKKQYQKCSKDLNEMKIDSSKLQV